MKTYRSAVSVLTVLALLAGIATMVTDRAASQEEEGPRFTIAVIPKGTTHEFWKSIHAGAVKAARELNVEIIWKGPQKEDDREQQITVVENFIARRVDGIVLAPLDNMALARPVRTAKRSGIPVVIIDSGLEGSDYVSFVATDNKKGGSLGAERRGAILGGKGKVVLLRYQEGSASTMNREAGFLETIQEKFPEIELISTNQYGGATTASAYEKAEAILNRFQGQIDGIFCPNESTTFGMLRALQEAGLAGKVKFVGFDSSEKLVQALKAKEIQGLVLQNPFRMGELGVRTMVRHLEGREVEKRIDTGVGVATPENMDEPEIRSLLSPDLSKYLD